MLCRDVEIVIKRNENNGGGHIDICFKNNVGFCKTESNFTQLIWKIQKAMEVIILIEKLHHEAEERIHNERDGVVDKKMKTLKAKFRAIWCMFVALFKVKNHS